jgi:hypothetical protein
VNCSDKAVLQRFFNLLRRERTCRKKYATREEAGQDVFGYIEFFISVGGGPPTAYLDGIKADNGSTLQGWTHHKP